MKARWLIKVWNSGKLGQLVYQRGISGVDAIEKVAQMLSPTSKDSLLILDQCATILGSHWVHCVVRGTVGRLDRIIKLLSRVGIGIGLDLSSLG